MDDHDPFECDACLDCPSCDGARDLSQYVLGADGIRYLTCPFCRDGLVCIRRVLVPVQQ